MCPLFSYFRSVFMLRCFLLEITGLLTFLALRLNFGACVWNFTGYSYFSDVAHCTVHVTPQTQHTHTRLTCFRPLMVTGSKVTRLRCHDFDLGPSRISWHSVIMFLCLCGQGSAFCSAAHTLLFQPFSDSSKQNLKVLGLKYQTFIITDQNRNFQVWIMRNMQMP